MILVILAIKLWSWYIIGYNNKRKRHLALLIFTFLFMIIDKKVVYSYNQLYTIRSLDI